MNDKALHHLRRDELLGMLLEIERENESIARENAELRQQLASRELTIESAGSLAEASLRLSGVFAAAQEAADTYAENVRLRCERRETESVERAHATRELCLGLARETERLCAERRADADATDAPSLVAQVEALFADLPDLAAPRPGASA